tara:strand:+ start:163 stop:549 length:387 start_codon:yes stop_codon:yes gene_type:complete
MVKKSNCLNMKVVFLGILLLGILGFSTYIGTTKNKEGLTNGRELVLVHMQKCPHCVKLMPEWKQAEKANKTNIKMRCVEMNELDGPDLCKKHKISGFPTILLLNGGEKEKEFNGERNKDGILSFLNNL